MNRNGAIYVVLADSQRLSLEGMGAILKESGDIRVAGTASDSSQVPSVVTQARPDVLIIESKMLAQVGDQNLARLRAASQNMKIILLSEEETAARAAAFAPPETKGLLLRTSDGKALVDAVRAVAKGSTYDLPARGGLGPKHVATRGKGLSPREHDIAVLISQGLSNREIAQRLGLSEQSVKNLVSRILKKQGFTNRVQIALERWVLQD